MRMITVFVPDPYLESIDLLVMEDQFPSRSEAIRYAIRKFLQDEFFDRNESHNLESQ